MIELQCSSSSRSAITADDFEDNFAETGSVLRVIALRQTSVQHTDLHSGPEDNSYSYGGVCVVYSSVAKVAVCLRNPAAVERFR